jgi:uncharacterized protein
MKKYMVIFCLAPSLLEVNPKMLVLLAIGIVASFVGTLAGGGGLITIPGMMLAGIPIQTSIATNKFSSGLAALSSVFSLARNKHIGIKTIFRSFLVACLGGICGAIFTSQINDRFMNIIAFILLSFSLVITLNNQKWVKNLGGNHDVPLKGFIPFLIAVYDGGFGPGSSIMGILLYLKKRGDYVKAVQLTRVLIFGSCTGAFLIYYQTGFIHWNYAIPMALGSIIGSQIGLELLPKIPIRVAQTLMITINCLLIVQIILKLKF